MDVDVVSTAVPILFGCSTEAELLERLRRQSLISARTRMNVCGLIARRGASSDFNGMLAYRHDNEVALVLASAVDGRSPGPASGAGSSDAARTAIAPGSASAA